MNKGNDSSWKNQVAAGIDVGKSQLHLAIEPAGGVSVHANDKQGVDEMVAALEQVEGLVQIVVEASGGYEKRLVRRLVSAGLAVSCVNARQARELARGLGVLAKNDRADARVLACCAQLGVFRLSRETSEYQQLQNLNRRRCQLIQARKVEKTRLHQYEDSQLRALVESMIHVLNEQIDRMEELIQQRIEADARLQRTYQIVNSFKGIGRRSAQILICALPELGRVNRGQIAALLGVAPWDDESGDREGHRKIWGGRRKLRSQIYMCSLSAITYNPQIRDFYQRLVDNGKLEKVALVAAIRKMIVILNTMVKNDELWNASA